MRNGFRLKKSKLYFQTKLNHFNICRLPHYAIFSIYGNAILFYFPFIVIAGLSTAIGLVLLGRRSQRIKGKTCSNGNLQELAMELMLQSKIALYMLQF